jgi:hypothetical protein
MNKILSSLLALLTVLAVTVSFAACSEGDPGMQGEQGPAGVSVGKIEKTATEGLTDTYTVTFEPDNAVINAGYPYLATRMLIEIDLSGYTGEQTVTTYYRDTQGLTYELTTFTVLLPEASNCYVGLSPRETAPFFVPAPASAH